MPRKGKKPERFTNYDSLDYLGSEAKIAAYLEAAIEEGGDDPAFLTRALGVVARAKNMSKLARAADISREGLYKALSGNGNPSFGTVFRVAKALGLKITVSPEEKAA